MLATKKAVIHCHQLYNHFDSCRFGFFLFVENMYGNATLLFVILSNYLQNFCTLDKNGNHHVHNTFEKGNLMFFLDNAYAKEISNITLMQKSDFRRL